MALIYKKIIILTLSKRFIVFEKQTKNKKT